MSETHKKMHRALNYFEHFLFLFSGCVSISAFASLIGVAIGIVNSVVGLKIYAITVGIKKYKSIITKKKKILNTIKVLSSKASID